MTVLEDKRKETQPITILGFNIFFLNKQKFLFLQTCKSDLTPIRLCNFRSRKINLFYSQLKINFLFNWNILCKYSKNFHFECVLVSYTTIREKNLQSILILISTRDRRKHIPGIALVLSGHNVTFWNVCQENVCVIF